MEIDTGGRIVGKKEIFFKIYHNEDEMMHIGEAYLDIQGRLWIALNDDGEVFKIKMWVLELKLLKL